MTTITAIKSVKQSYHSTPEILKLMNAFRWMVNDCIKIGLQNNTSTMKKLCQLSYCHTGRYNIINYYRLCAISHAAGILTNRKKSLKRGRLTRDPNAKKLLLISCYGFKIDRELGLLKIPLGNKQYLDIKLNSYVRQVLFSDPSIKIRSFTLTESNLIICYSNEVKLIEWGSTSGIDRNLANLTYGNSNHAIQYDISKAVNIAENTRSIISSFKRNDMRISKKLAMKYGQRRRNRINQLLHKVSKHIIEKAKQNQEAIVFEDIRRIRQLYQRGNYQSRDYRAKMNSWSFYEVKRQIEYKAAWEGVPVIQLTVKDTRGTSRHCPRCGKRTQEAGRDDKWHRRQLWCGECQRWLDRDIVAAMNISYKGRAFLSNDGEGVFERPQGLAGEAMKGNPTTTVILRVDASKLSCKACRTKRISKYIQQMHRW